MLTVDKYTTLNLSEYKGTYQIQEGRDSDGTFKPQFIKKEFGKRGDGEWKTIPLSVKIGDKETAERTLLAILTELTGKQYEPNAKDVPF
jgi:hypothetical protein